MKILRNKKFLTVMAMVLMVAMVVGMGTMTYARYVSSASMANPESATVADWGYVLTISYADMFGAKYEDNVVKDSFTATESDKIDVTAGTSAQLVAPGTSGSMTVTLSGKAEVLAQITFDILEGSKDAVLVYKTTAEGQEQTYNPIKWTLTKKVGDGEATTVGTANTTFANIVTSMEAESAKVEAGTNIAQTVYTLSWSWAINESMSATDATNQLDTALGMFAAGKDVAAIQAATGLIVVTGTGKTNDTLSVQLSATVVQIQD